MLLLINTQKGVTAEVAFTKTVLPPNDAYLKIAPSKQRNNVLI
jgi:hypothetical protein